MDVVVMMKRTPSSTRNPYAAHDLSITNFGDDIKVAASTRTNSKNVIRAQRPPAQSTPQSSTTQSRQGDPIDNTPTQSRARRPNQQHDNPIQRDDSPTEPNESLRTWLHARQLSGYLRVLATDPWADMEAVLSTINVEEITV